MEGADSEETMKLGMRMKKSVFVLGACVALSGYVVACGDDTDTTMEDGGAGKGGTGGSGGKGGTGGKSGTGGTGGKSDSDAGAEDAGK